MDGWCAPIVLGEVLASHEAAREGRAVRLPISRPYRDYIDWLGSLDRSGEESVLASPASRLSPGDSAADRSAIRPFGRLRRTDGPAFEPGDGGPGRDGPLAAGWTLGTIVPGAWALLLGRYSGEDEVVIGVTVAGRPAGLDGVESMVGLFINTLPARVGLPEEAPLADWLTEFQGGLIELRRHEATPLVRIQKWSDVPRGRPLFESIVVVANTPDDPEARALAARLGVGEIRSTERTNFPMTIRATPGPRLT